jgi:HK97 gp10 family phage protein
MEFTVKVEGVEKLKRANEAVLKAVNAEIDTALFAVAKKVEKDAKELILGGQKSGRVYKRGNVTHRASAPGEAPASDTGRLVNSINGTFEKGERAAIIRAGGGIVRYARMLEFGTTKMAPRPFMFPAAERARRWIEERLKEALKRGIVRGSR